MAVASIVMQWKIDACEVETALRYCADRGKGQGPRRGIHITYVMYVAGVLLCGVVQFKFVQGNDIFILHEYHKSYHSLFM